MTQGTQAWKDAALVQVTMDDGTLDAFLVADVYFPCSLELKTAMRGFEIGEPRYLSFGTLQSVSLAEFLPPRQWSQCL